jgi:serine/threonine protein kinase
MDEQAPKATAPEDTQSAASALASSADSSVQELGLLRIEQVDADDNAPTVISRNLHASARSEEALKGVVRGRRLAHFELIEPIGVGGMAAVIRARDTQLDRIVALKILPAEMAGDPENIRRFQHEARAAAKLDHENIARVFFCGEDQGLHFIAFEFVEGETLRAIVAREGKLSVPLALGYMLQIASGLAHVATRGVIHRDIKPSNIIITPTGRAKLVDMGLARSMVPLSDGELTRSGVTLGTIDYISPEQAMEPRDADIRSDIYSLGCTFYHMLTGQPPVPEGTAARKLHHQQYVPPVDPRQLNPEIPDEIAALLARMMAKDPADRFQDPEQLVNHLLALVRKYTGSSEEPGGVLLVDALLPSPPRTRPMLFVLAATVALVVLIIVLAPPTPWSLAPSRTGPSNAGKAPAEVADESVTPRGTEENVEPAKDAVIGPSRLEAITPASCEPANGRELVEFLRRGDLAARVYLANDLTLSREDQLVFQGRDLTILAKDPNQPPPIIRLVYDGYPPPERAALTIKSGTVRIEGVRFVIDAREASELVMSAVAVTGGHVVLKRCEFEQEYPPKLRESRVSSVSVFKTTFEGSRPSLELNECFFAEGQHAVILSGPVTVKCTQCAFAPQASSIFEIQPGRFGEENGATLTLVSASSLVQDGTVFRLNEGALCRLEAKESVFSKPDITSPAGGCFIEQAGEQIGELHYRGFNNCYSNLKCLWGRDSAENSKDAVADLDGFRNHLGVQDEKSFVTAFTPWESPDPARALRVRELRQAFRLNTNLTELRRSRNAAQLIGVETCVWGASYDKLPALVQPPPEAAARGSERIVDPSVQAQVGNIYQTLRQALEAALPGDSILIKHNGSLKVDPVRFEKAGSDITIRPYGSFQPVLSIGETTEPDAALFRVYDGRLALERLEFHFQHPQADFKAQSVVTLMGDGQCVFKNCVATLEETKEVPLSLVTLADPSSVMKMNPHPSGQQDPRIEIDGCFVRGAGDLVSIRASRTFDLNIENSLVVLDGSLLLIEGNATPKDVNSRGRGGAITLNHVSTQLNDHLIWLRAHQQEGMSAKGLVPTQVKSATNCLFVSANGKSLIHLDGVDTDEQMKRLFAWSESRHNAYGNFISWLDLKPAVEGENMSPVPFGRTQWESFTQETDSRYERIRFSAPMPGDLPLARAALENFRIAPESNVQGFGADVDRLPRPYERSETSP